MSNRANKIKPEVKDFIKVTIGPHTLLSLSKSVSVSVSKQQGWLISIPTPIPIAIPIWILMAGTH